MNCSATRQATTKGGNYVTEACPATAITRAAGWGGYNAAIGRRHNPTCPMHTPPRTPSQKRRAARKQAIRASRDMLRAVVDPKN